MARDMPVTDLGTISGGALSIPVDVNRINKMVLAGNVISSALVLTPPATSVCISVLLIITQDATGNRTVAWPANFRWQGGFSPSLSTAAGATDVVQAMTVDGGTSWLAVIAFQVAA